MQEKSLLDKVKKLNQILLESDTGTLMTEKVFETLGSIIGCNIFFIDPDGKPLECYFNQELTCEILQQNLSGEGTFLPGYNIQQFLSFNESQVNITFGPGECGVESGNLACGSETVYVTGIPVFGGGYRLGTLLLHRPGVPFEHDDLIMAEISTAIAGMLLMRSEFERHEEESRNKATATIAFESLSYSEVEAIEEIFKNLRDNENIVVASKIADDLGITRSVIVNALRKFESAGIIESRSLGMKGTYIKVKNPEALREITNRSVRLKNATHKSHIDY